MSLTLSTPLSLQCWFKQQRSLPHKVADITARNVPLSCAVDALERGVGFEGAKFAEVLAAELVALFAFSDKGKQLAHLLNCRNRNFPPMHFLILN